VTTETIDDFSDISPESVEAQPGPLSGSRGTNRAAGTGTGSSASARTRSSRLQKRIDQLQVRLSQEMFMGGTMIGMALPVTGYYIGQESHDFTKAICELASSRPEWVDALEKLADLQPGFVVGRTVIGIGGALSVDRRPSEKKEDAANGKFMQFLGVTRAYMAVSGKGAGNASNGVSSYVPPPGGTFVPVS
jgi:hypothetical protein